MTERRPLVLDGVDHLIVQELERDGRLSVAALSKRLRMSWSTVADKLVRLEQARVLRFLAIADTLALGYSKQLLVGISTPPSHIDSVTNSLLDIHEVYHVSIHTGRFDILASVSLPSDADLWEFVRSRLAPITDITRAEVMVCLKVVKFSLSLSENRSVLPSRSGPVQPLDDLDVKLVRALRASPRASLPELAAVAGCSKATARRRVQRLLEDEVVKVVAAADPVRLGYGVRASIGLNVQPGMIDRAAAALSESPDTHHVLITTGSYDLLFTTFFRTHDELSAFIRDTLGTIPGVLSHETMVLMKVAKDNLGADWGFRA